MTKSKAIEAEIIFRQGVDNAGFSSSTTSNVANAEATTIIRELIQNSVDAAKSIKRSKTVIRFEIDQVESSRLPGFSNVKDAFGHAVKAQAKLNGGTLPDVQQEIVEGFEQHLKDKKCSVLSVTDNGIGLTRDTMNALLSDGRSAKSSAGSGAHGYGHLTVLPSSGIRLVYYGGKSDSDARVAAGHCVLASFHDGKDSRKKDGYLVRQVNEDMFDPFDFLTDDDIPELISSKLDEISEQWGTGTVVQVPFFNYFRSPKEDLWELIKKAAATNFFASIMNDEIVIEYVNGSKTKQLSQENIEDVLNEFSGERNARSFIAGAKALECFYAIKNGEEVTLKTGIGSVSGRLVRHGAGKTSRIDLCRNGMWIVFNNSPGRQLSKLQSSAFEGYQRFHLVLLLKADDGDLHKLVRNAEPPLHDAVDVKRLSRDSRDKLTAAFKSVQEEIKGLLDPIVSNVVSMDDILTVLGDGKGSGPEKDGIGGEWERFERRASSRGGNTPGRDGPGRKVGPRKGVKTKGPGRGGTKTKAKGKPSPFKAISVPTGARSYEFEIHPTENLEGGSLQFKIDQNLDETCAQTSKESHLRLKNIKIDGKSVDSSKVVKGLSGNVEGIELDELVVNKKINVKFDFELSDRLEIPSDRYVGLEAEITKRTKRTESGE